MHNSILMVPRRSFSTLFALSLLLVTACGGSGEVSETPAVEAPVEARNPLTDPDPDSLKAAAPDSFTLVFATSKGDIEVRLRRDWSPLGVDRLHYLATNGFFDGARFYRVVPDFVVQFGLSGRPDVDAAFKRLMIPDDSVKVPNRRGTIVFATSGPNTRTTQLFINLSDNRSLDEQGFSPLGEVTRGMDVVDQINPEYLEQSNQQRRIEREGNAFFRSRFPALDSIVRVTVMP